MRLRKSRIAWSVVWSAVTLLIVALWVHSYGRWDCLTWHHGGGVLADAANGQIGIVVFRSGDLRRPIVEGMVFDTSISTTNSSWPAGVLGFSISPGDLDLSFLVMPYWFLSAVTVAAAGVPWVRWRFGLRALLVATTLVAVVLGLIVSS